MFLFVKTICKKHIFIIQCFCRNVSETKNVKKMYERNLTKKVGVSLQNSNEFAEFTKLYITRRKIWKNIMSFNKI